MAFTNAQKRKLNDEIFIAVANHFDYLEERASAGYADEEVAALDIDEIFQYLARAMNRVGPSNTWPFPQLPPKGATK